ncbi:MAG: hypothetical protein SF052_06790 [Bacteroidia bacterium]|nr:hypothetical protein [Bacteroidia bacterium]
MAVESPGSSRAVVKINREYRDVITQEVIEVREDFVELLTHDSYLIQLRRLSGQARTRLERVLQVFSPEYKTEDPHQLNYTGEVQDTLVRKMVDRLGRAIANEEIREKMDVEDEIERIFEREMRKKDQIIAEKEQEIEKEKQKAEKEKQKAEKEKQKAEKEKQKAEKEKQKAEKEKQKAEKEKQKAQAKEQELKDEKARNEDLLRQIEELKSRLKK